MKSSDITKVIEKLIKQRLPVFIWGAPGIGKSSIVKSIAKEKNLEFIDLRLSLLDPTDLKGIPFFDSKTKEGVWAKPSFLPKEDDKREGILFLDEINTAPPSVQASAYQLVLDRKIGDYTLPSGWSIISAGNRENDRGVVYKMPPPLANRFVHFEMEVNFEDWKAWAYLNNIDSSIIAFLSYDKSMLFNFDPTSSSKGFATPRSWEFVNTILNSNIDDNLLFETILGAVGKDVSVGFLSFRKIMDRLPSINSILDGTLKSIEDTDDTKLMMALSIGIVNILKDDKDMDSINNVLAFSLTIPAEYSIMLIKDMQQNSINVEESSRWEEWVREFEYLLS
jgi:hypothetical protein